jgi:hypothetical protein
MAAAIGQTSPNPLPVHGPLWFDARAFGVSPQNPDNGPALQAAHDAAAAALAAITGGFFSGVQPTATIFIPGSRTPYTLKTPVFIEANGVEIRGERGSTQLVGMPSSCYTLLYCGISRVGQGNVPNAAYRPDLWNGGNSKLDSSVVTAANQKWGIRTNSDAFVVAQDGVFSHGGLSPTTNMPDSWRETAQFTMEFAVEGFASGKMPGGLNLFAIGTTGGSGSGATTAGEAACPFFVQTTGTNAYKVFLNTQSSRFSTTWNVYSFSFSSGTATGVQKIALQVDWVAGLVTAYVNGTQVAVTGSTLPANSIPNENQVLPFTINSYLDGTSQSSGGDFALYGYCISLSNRYATNGAGTAQVAHPQFSSTANNGPGATLTLPGSPTGGTWTFTYGGVTSAPISAAANAATIQAAVQSMSSIGPGNMLVTGGQDTGGGIEFQVATANGFVFKGAPGQCNGSNLTGASIRDVYRYFPFPQNYPYNRDAYALGYFAFTENPATAPRHLTIQGGAAVGGPATVCSSLLFNNRSNDAISGENRFTDITLNISGEYGIALAMGHVIHPQLSGVTARAGLHGAGNIPQSPNYFVVIRDCSFSGQDAGYYANSSLIQMDYVTLDNNNRYALRLFRSAIQAKHIVVGNYGVDPCAFAYLAGGGYGGSYAFEDVTLDLEGGSAFQRALFYCENTSYGATSLKVSRVIGGILGSVPLFKLACVGNPPTWPGGRIDAEDVGADALGGVVDIDGPNWTGEVRGSLADGGSYVVSNQSFGRPRIVVVDNQSPTFPRFGSWFAGTVKIKVPGPVDGQYEELRVAADGGHGSATPPQWAGVNAIQASPNASLGAYAIDHTSISATLSGRASSNGYLTNPARMELAQTLFGGGVSGASSVFTLTGTGLGGTFTLSYGGQTTAGLAYNATAGTVQTALQGLSSVGAGNMTVGGNAGGPWTINLAGSLANLAGGILGLTVNPAGLTATGPSVATSGTTVTFSGVTGGNWTITGGGKTTAPLAWNASAPTVVAAIVAAGLPTSYGIQYALPNCFPGVYYGFNTPYTINSSGLTGGGAATLVNADVPSTWYVALLTTNVHPAGTHYSEPNAGATGYARAAFTNNTTNFGSSSSGSKTSGTSISFPTATGAYTVQSIALFPSPTSTQAWAVIQLASPLVVSAGTTPTISGGLTFSHVPYSGHFAGAMTDFAWGKVHDLLFGGTSFTPPATWYAALSTAAVSRSTTSLAEPPSGYARKAITNSSANWLVGGSNDTYSQPGDARNAAVVTFPAPTATWGSVVATALTDSATGGNAWFVAPLTAPVAPAAGTPAPTFAAGAFRLATA